MQIRLHADNRIAKNTGGFTLMELALVIIISGVLTAAILIIIKNYQKKIEHEKTVEAIESAKAAVQGFYASQGRFPCPANPNLAPNNPMFGREDCKIAPVAGMRPDLTNDEVLIGTLPVYALQDRDEDRNSNGLLDAGEDRNGNSRLDTDEDANNNGILDAGEDKNMNGVLNRLGRPLYLNDADRINYKNLNLTDAWDNRLTYAVTRELSDPSGTSANPRLGAIRIVDEFGNDTGGSNGNAMYAIISHGRDHMGARSVFGNLQTACDATFVQQGENCDGDGTFVQSLARLDEQNPGEYYDDYIDFSLTATTGLWDRMGNSTTGATTESIYNLNSGNVGINTTTPDPAMKLDVNGAVRTNMAVAATEICTGADCIDAGTIYNINCDDSTKGNYIKSVTHDLVGGKKVFAVTCGPLEFAPVTRDCGPSGLIKEIRTNGDVICF